MKELQFTLYEVFGYLLPGTVLTVGLAVLFWALYFPQHAVEFDLKSVEVWVLFLVLAYVCGHIAQGIGNAISSRLTSVEEKVVNRILPAELVAACTKKAKELTGAETEKLPAKWLVRLCDDAVMRSGKLGEREVYVYREGFYRGTFVGLLIVIVGFLAMAVRLWTQAPGQGFARVAHLEFTPWRLMFFIVAGIIGEWFLWQRYWRFAEYRVTQALLGFLTIKDRTSDSKDGKDGKPQ